MKIIDLSHTISPEMPVYPGTAPPRFEYPCTIAKDGFLENRITLFSHTGTHMDAPAHILEGGKTLDRYSADHFFGPAICLDVSGSVKKVIDSDDLEPHVAIIERSEYVLIHSGWSRHWGKAAYFKGYPVFSTTAARWLSAFPLKGIGVDMISVDETGTTDFSVHRVLLEREMILIENLTGLSKLPKTGFTFAGFPLKTEKADGAPVRAVAMVP